MKVKVVPILIQEIITGIKGQGIIIYLYFSYICDSHLSFKNIGPVVREFTEAMAGTVLWESISDGVLLKL